MEKGKKSLEAESECPETNQNDLKCLISQKKCGGCKVDEAEVSNCDRCLQSGGNMRQNELEPDEFCSSDELSLHRIDLKKINYCNGSNRCGEGIKRKCPGDMNLCGKGETNMKDLYDSDEAFMELSNRKVVDEVALKQKIVLCESTSDEKTTIEYELRISTSPVTFGKNASLDDCVNHCEESHQVKPFTVMRETGLFPKMEGQENSDSDSCPLILNDQKTSIEEDNHFISASNQLEAKAHVVKTLVSESLESEVTILNSNIVKSVNGYVNSKQKRSKSKFEIDDGNDTPVAAATERETNKSSKRKRSTAPEKEKLRDCIRKMLLDFGWKIEYRPRRDRDYFDAVYLNPSGTAYWSILKAYDALQKQQNRETNEGQASSSDAKFSLIPDDLLKQLTRNTKKKREREMGRSATKMHPGKISGKSAKLTISSTPRAYQKRKNRKLGRCKLLARCPGEGRDSKNEEFAASSGKRTILSWLLATGAVNIGQKVVYSNCDNSKPMLEGWIAREGIRCGCCNKTISVSNFETHSGSKLLHPFQSIRLDSGGSLLDCQVGAWNIQNSVKKMDFQWVNVDSGDPNDDICCLCGDGGSLLCCDGCPSTYHQSCLEIKTLPPGDWSCPNCVCKYCGLSSEKPVSNEATCEPILKCHLCVKKYHKSCVMEESDSKTSVGGFCGVSCEEIFEGLQSLLGVKHQLEGGYSWTLIHRTDVDLDTGAERVECNSKVAVAYQLMDECFLPILDIRSGIEMVHNFVFNCGSNFNRLNFEGFYIIVLENGDEMISAASLRFHGSKLSEMPFIGTRNTFRRQGMWRRLMDAVEYVVASLKVERLIIPAISEVKSTWQDVFGFLPVDESLKEELKTVNVLVFPGVDMLEKRYSDSIGSLSDEGLRTERVYPNKEESVEMVCGFGIEEAKGNEFEDGSSQRAEVVANTTQFGGDKICTSIDCDVVCT